MWINKEDQIADYLEQIMKQNEQIIALLKLIADRPLY